MNALLKAALQNALRTSTILFVFALVATALLAFTFTRTYPTIERSEQAAKLARLSQVLPPALYDNDLLNSRRTLPADEDLGAQQPSTLWIARRAGAVSAVVIEAVAPDGYSGDIELLIGMDVTGKLTGVRVTAHRETPGLGDYIDRNKSPWIEQFVGKSLTQPTEKKWTVTKDGGSFDARAGATITPRAVVKAVKHALEYFAKHRTSIIASTVPAKE